MRSYWKGQSKSHGPDFHFQSLWFLFRQLVLIGQGRNWDIFETLNYSREGGVLMTWLALVNNLNFFPVYSSRYVLQSSGPITLFSKLRWSEWTFPGVIQSASFKDVWSVLGVNVCLHKTRLDSPFIGQSHFISSYLFITVK